mgnify:CR=1 FL=1
MHRKRIANRDLRRARPTRRSLFVRYSDQPEIILVRSLKNPGSPETMPLIKPSGGHIILMHAQRNGVPKVLAKMTRPNYMELVASTGIDSIISPKDIVANQITRYCRALGNAEGSKVESLYKMLGGHVEALSFTATASAREMLSTPLKDLKLRREVLLAAIVRRGEIIIPGGMTTIEEGDRVVVVTRNTGLNDLRDILAD